MAVPFAVLKVALTVAVLAKLSVTVKTAATVPPLPSARVTSLMLIFGFGGMARTGAAATAVRMTAADSARTRGNDWFMSPSEPPRRLETLLLKTAAESREWEGHAAGIRDWTE